MPLFLRAFTAGNGLRFLFRTPGSSAHSLSDRALLKAPRRFQGCCLTSVDGITKHLGNRCGSTKEVNLKTVGLFFRPGFGVNAPDV